MNTHDADQGDEMYLNSVNIYLATHVMKSQLVTTINGQYWEGICGAVSLWNPCKDIKQALTCLDQFPVSEIHTQVPSNRDGFPTRLKYEVSIWEDKDWCADEQARVQSSERAKAIAIACVMAAQFIANKEQESEQ
jgi:hypothetical protein